MLEKENQRLSNLEKARDQYDGRTFEELAEVLRSEKVAFTFKDKSIEMSIFRAAHRYKANLATGVTNHIDSSDFESKNRTSPERGTSPPALPLVTNEPGSHLAVKPNTQRKPVKAKER